MKAFRHILAIILIAGTVSGSVLYTSCNKNKCGGTTCQNGGTCTSNVCVCPMGYSGNSCQTGWSDASIGTYTCTRSSCVPSATGATTWQSSVVKNASNSGYTINITNFDNNNITVTATIDSLHNIKISPASGAYGVNASGTYASGVINLKFTTAYPSGVSYSCNMTMTKM